MFKKGEVVKIGKSVFLVENVWKGDVNVIYRLRDRNGRPCKMNVCLEETADTFRSNQILVLEHPHAIPEKETNIYWSNSCGDLHYGGFYDVNKDDLPQPLQTIYDEWFIENEFGFHNYLFEKNSRYGMAIEAEYYKDDRKVNNLSVSEYDMFVTKMEHLIKYCLKSVKNFPVEVELERDTGDDDVVSIIRVFVPYDAGKKVYKRVGTILERLSPFWTDWN